MWPRHIKSTSRLLRYSAPHGHTYASVWVASRRLTCRVNRQELDELGRLLEESKGDAELHAMAVDEHAARKQDLEAAEARLLRALAPRDAADDRSALLEIRAGTGGLEASLFVQDLLAMYQHHAKRQGWRFDIVTAATTDAGGYREVCASPWRWPRTVCAHVAALSTGRWSATSVGMGCMGS